MAQNVYGLPSVQVRDVVDTSMSETENGGAYRLINRVPEPGEAEVPSTLDGAPTPILLQVLPLYGEVSAQPLGIRVDGQVVVQNGEIVGAGWSGVIKTLGDAVVSASLVRATPFGSAHVTEVRVTYEGAQLDPYSFVWRDETPPVVEDAAPEGLFIVRVTFDEPVAPTSALVPSKYRLRAVSPFAAVPEPTVVSTGASAREVWVGFSQPLTFGATYAIVVTGVADRYGNVIEADDAERTFVAALPEVPAGRRFVLWDFVPELHKRLDRDGGALQRFVSVLQEPTDLLLYEIDRFAQITDPDFAPEDFVDAMLADLGNPFDVSGLELGEKRKLLALLLSLYQQKGTTEGLIDAARTLLGLTISVHPLNEGGWMLGVHELGNPDTTWLAPETSFQRFAFEVVVLLPHSAPVLLAETRARLVELIHVMRPAHTHFRRLIERINDIDSET